MLGHTLAKLYASILEHSSMSSVHGQRHATQAPKQLGFWYGYSTLDHVFTLMVFIEEGRAHGRRIYCCFVDIHKAFDTLPRAQLMHRLHTMGVPCELIWGIMFLCELVTSRMRTSEGDF
eukprot:c34075_g1_i1 orf=3-356(-)